MDGEAPRGDRSAACGTAEQAVSFLLSRNLLLTAFELVHEAGEAGLGQEVEPLLLPIFKDPRLFPAEAVSACNPDGEAHERQQQLSQLQYELAVAKEDLAALRAQLATQQLQQHGEQLPPQQAVGGKAAFGAHGQGAASGGGVRQLAGHQLAVLNQAVLAYLQAHGYQLAALSLSKEAALPAAAAGTGTPADGSLAAWYCAAQDAAKAAAVAQAAEERASTAEAALAASRGREEAATAELEFVKGKLCRMEQQAAEVQVEAAAAMLAEQEQQGGGSRGMAVAAVRASSPLPAQVQQQAEQQAAPLAAQARGGPAVAALGAAGALVEAAAAMPRILPSLLINKRDELVPALLALCQEHPEPAGRRQLADLLFSLIKKPNAAQRAMITGACVQLARRIGGPRLMLELLPTVHSQVHHELLERRLLVAEAVAALAPHLPRPQAASTVLSLVEALLQDSQTHVRCRAVAALAALPAALGPRDTSAAPDVMRLLLSATADFSGDVGHALQAEALPAMLGWLEQSELLLTLLLPQILDKLHQVLNHCPAVAGMQEGSHTNSSDARVLLRSVPAGVQSQAAALLQLYMGALPTVRTYALRTQPGWVAGAADAPPGEQPRGSAAASARQQRIAQEQQQSPLAAQRPVRTLPNPFAQAGVPCGLMRPGSNGGSVDVPRRHTMASGGMPAQQAVAVGLRCAPLPPMPAPFRPLLVEKQQQSSRAAQMAEAPAEAPPAAVHAEPADGGATGHTGVGSEPPVNPSLHSAASEERVARHSSGPTRWTSGAAGGHSVSSGGGNTGWPTVNNSIASSASTPPVRQAISGCTPFAWRAEDASSQGTQPGSWRIDAGMHEMEQGGAIPVAAADARGSVVSGLLSSLGPNAGPPAPSAAPAAGHAGDGARLQSGRRHEAACIAAWVQAGEWPEAWPILEFMANSAVPGLLRVALMVDPASGVLTQQLGVALKTTCIAMGEQFADAAVAPQLAAAAALPDWLPNDSPARGAALHVHLVAAGLLAPPVAPAARLAGLACALPLLLSAVLPYAGSHALSACLRRLCTDGGSGSGEVWALQHPRPLVAAVHCAAEVGSAQEELFSVLWELVASKQGGARQVAALLAGAAAPALHPRQVMRQLLPLLSTLGHDASAAVRQLSLAAAAAVFAGLPGETELQEALQSTLDDILVARGHSAELALFAALAPAAAAASAPQLEWLLQRLLFMLAAMHQRGARGRSPGELAEAAEVVFFALRRIEAHEFTEQRLHMHFVAALAALQRESDLLGPAQRGALAAMLDDHESALVAASTGGTAASSGNAALQSLVPPAHTAALRTAPAMRADQFAAAPAQLTAGELQEPAGSSIRSASCLASLFQPANLLAADADAPLAHFLAC